MNPLTLSPELHRQIEAEGVAAFPNECCGILIGKDVSGGSGGGRIVHKLVAGKNAFEADEQYHRFSIDPRAQLKAEREAEAAGLAVLGFYHSHPNHPARPSEYDRDHGWPFYSYVIVSVMDGKPADMTSWVLNEKTNEFDKQPILVRETMNSYAHPEALVDTEWVANHAKDPNVKVLEVDVDTTSYDKGHIPGAIGWNWQLDLQDRVQRDVVDPRTFAELCRRSGIKPTDTVVIYGDNNNWFAAWALWQFKYHGHKDVRLMNGGRKKWELEKRPLTTDPPQITRSEYPIPPADESIRAYRQEVLDTLGQKKINLVDVRSPDEFTGKIIAPPGMTETAQRGGHIPGATSIPWAKAANEDGTFKSSEELKKIYQDAGVDFARPTIAYCRIGERSSHTWFVFKYLLGQDNVKNYDGSWTEWGNLVGVPIEKGDVQTALPNVKCE
ncbi:MAG TPA: rhodanese-like domain-containing protein [Tepidisphaeraceae bacterium]|nr:rhodanese-like domain-containing protein [Tepidisphaeraceae bacterium]